MSWGSSTFKINHQVPQGSHLQFHRHQCHHHLLHHDQPATQWSLSWQPFYFRGFGRHEDSNIRGKGLDLPLTARFSSIILSIIFRLEICQKFYTTGFLCQKFYTLKMRKLGLILPTITQRKSKLDPVGSTVRYEMMKLCSGSV